MDFDKMNLLALRSYARELGVKCPTGQTKDSLIREIEKILRGETLPYRTKRGRPPKLESVTSFVNRERIKKEKREIDIKIEKTINDFKIKIAEEVDLFMAKTTNRVDEFLKNIILLINEDKNK